MKVKGFLLGIVVLLLVVVAPVAAQDDSRQELPTTFWLEGLQQHWQQYNRCSAAALTIQLSYFDWGGSHTQVMHYLNPNPVDVSVRIEEMLAFIETQGLKGITRTGGTIDLLRALVANGFPVLVETSYFDDSDSYGDWMAHNRVVMGYDNGPAQLLYLYDPLMGNGPDNLGITMPYYEFDERWRPFNRNYLVIYRPEDEEELQLLLGDQWDTEKNAEWTLEQAQADRETYQDAFSLFNIGSAQVVLGQYEEAAKNFDLARDTGLPHRMMWYQFGPFEAYLQVGRFEDVRSLVYEVLEGTSEVEEMYYFIARAYEGLGDIERAKANYSAAVYRNANFHEAREALTATGG